ncbi:ABC transporter ATP-binding protein [Vibrio sp. MA40-2]|uniref:ABC transporter ATP-binding protein n=1 Tax=Vibrio sp. MA40-2 TaxID=3391828 RepID=UPI0039A69FEF
MNHSLGCSTAHSIESNVIEHNVIKSDVIDNNVIDNSTIANNVLIEVKALSRSFGNSVAVDEVNFVIQPGEICAFLGPNGAGKTTIIKMLTGLLEPSSGHILYQNEQYDPSRLALKKMIGVVPQHNNLDKELTLTENLRVHGLLYKMRGSVLNNAIEQCLEFAQLSEHKNKPAGKLSGGMKRKLVIARALMHNPKILFLDEPTVGLDPLARRKMLSFLSKINRERECTIFLTTHYIEEAEKLAERVIFIDRGRIVTQGTSESLKQQLGCCAIDIEKEELEQEFFAHRDDALVRIKALGNVPVSIRETTLEDVFVHFTGTRLHKNV